MSVSKLIYVLSLVTLTFLLASEQVAALEEREFHNADQTKSFRATLTDFDAKKGLVTVEMSSGKKKSFKIQLLSKDDQKYIKQNAKILTIARGFAINFKEVKGETTRTKAGLIRTRKTPHAYQIQLSNRSKKVVENVEVRYSFYYCVGSSSATGPRHTPKVAEGVLSYPKMFPQYTEIRKTAEVTLIRESKKGVAPPAPSGGGRGGG